MVRFGAIRLAVIPFWAVPLVAIPLGVVSFEVVPPWAALGEGEIAAGDEIVKVGEAGERMTVAEINALLYLLDHALDRLERALRIEALSPGWRGSLETLLQSQQIGAETGNAGLAPAAAAHPARKAPWPEA